MLLRLDHSVMELRFTDTWRMAADVCFTPQRGAQAGFPIWMTPTWYSLSSPEYNDFASSGRPRRHVATPGDLSNANIEGPPAGR